ncbi:MAG: vWA domain-containing protein, partial [Burkholderiales bacterium]
MAGDSKKNGAGGRAGGRLAANVMQFARTLRAAGLPVGPGKVLEALRAVEAVGFASRQDFYWALHSVFVNRRDQRELFDQAFHLFWRNPRILDRIMDLLLPSVQPTTRPQEDEREAMSRRLAEALGTEGGGESEDEGKEEIEVDAALTWSDRELLQGRDFEQMSAAELAEAKQLVKGLRLPIMALPTRRFRPDDRGARADLRAMFRAALRSGSDNIPLKRRAPQRRHPPLVVLCDISGSMSRYSRMFLHFLHAITNDRDRVHSFV